MKSKYYNFVKDLFLFAISTFIPKAITFFLVPLYTNYMSTSEYGVVDIVTTTISVLVPLLTLDIADSVLRSTIENKKNNNPYSFGLKMLNNATLIVIGVVIVNKLCGFFEVADWLILLFTIQFYLTGLYGINISYLRATDRIMLLVTTSIINTCTQVLYNIILLVILRMGLNGFLLSNIISLTVVNAGAIEKNEGTYYSFKQAICPSTIAIVDALWKEKKAVMDALGMPCGPSPSGNFKKYADPENHSFDNFKNLSGPDSMQERHITEDIPVIGCLFLSVARFVGVETPLYRALVTVASAINHTDYYKDGRTLENLGLGELRGVKIREYFKNEK